MVTPELLEYIRSHQSQGIADQPIREALVEAGWTSADIEAAFQSAKPAVVEPVAAPGAPAAAVPNLNDSMPASGRSAKEPNGPFPLELRRWNWGAFFLGWIWGIGNDTYIALLCLIPVVNLVMIFVLGAKGNEWAWKHRQFRDIGHFKKVQRAWSWWGAGLFAFGVLANALLVALSLSHNLPTTLPFIETATSPSPSPSASSPDTRRVSDLQVLASEISTFESDNSGTPPVSLSMLDDSIHSVDPVTGNLYEYSVTNNSYTITAQLDSASVCASKIWQMKDGSGACK